MSPLAPILLIITALGVILGLLSVIVALLPWSKLFRPCKAAIPAFCSSRNTRLHDDPESVQGLVLSTPALSATAPPAVRYGKVNYGVLAFGIPAFGTSIAAVVKAFEVANTARDKWSLDQAGSVGLRMDDGAALCRE